MTPYGYAGRSLGAAGGAGLGGSAGLLSDVLSPLDWPRAGVANLARGGYRLLSGEGDYRDLLGMAPAALGGAAGFLLGGGPLGAALGAGALHGLGQELGLPAAPTPQDVTEFVGADPESMLQTLAVTAATDPLTYAGGVGGFRGGARYGSYLDDVRRTMGPMYPGTIAEKFDPLIAQARALPSDPYQVARRLELMAGGPEAGRLAGEIERGSRLMGQGVEGIAVGAEASPQVTRLGGGPLADDLRHGMMGPAPRADLPELLPAARTAPVGPYRVEQLPRVDVLKRADVYGDPMTAAGWSPEPLAQELEFARGGLFKSLAGSGGELRDAHLGNLARTPGGRYVVLDPSSAVPSGAGFSGIPPSGPEQFAQRAGDPFSRALVRLTGGPAMTRREIASGLTAGAERAGLSMPEVEALQGVTHAGLREQIAQTRATRDALWQKALQARGGGAGDEGVARLMEQMRAADTQLVNLQNQLRLPGQRGAFGVPTPLEPFEDAARVLGFQRRGAALGSGSPQDFVEAAYRGSPTQAVMRGDSVPRVGEILRGGRGG